MRILKPGKTSPKEYDQTCTHCACEFVFGPHESEYVYDYRLLGTNCKTGTALKVKCPECGKDCWHYDPK